MIHNHRHQVKDQKGKFDVWLEDKTRDSKNENTIVSFEGVIKINELCQQFLYENKMFYRFKAHLCNT